jgi:hypothetical protein
MATFEIPQRFLQRHPGGMARANPSPDALLNAPIRARNLGVLTMIAAGPFFDLLQPNRSADPGMPHFVESFLTDTDDLDDWWLDLGAVDFSAAPAM